MSDETFSVLIVDDEPNIRSGLEKGLIKEADSIVQAGDADEAWELFQKTPFQLVIADIRLPSAMNGLELLERLLRSRPQTSVIVITAHGTVETAVQAMRLGAFDFITKPLDLDLIRQQVAKAREHHRLQVEVQELRTRLADAGEVSGIVGNSPTMLRVLREVRQVARTDATVMICGESGTGKELIARALHDLSDRSENAFVAVNLGALPETLLESELFGHEKGSFTGANRQKPGCFERARGGSLFLDEITEIPAKCQVDLLRVLESQQFSRIGGEEVMDCDVRLISATNKLAAEEVEGGGFREDLYYRLNVVPINLPPLRQRREDIPLLIEHFLARLCKRHARDPKTLSADALQRLVAARWPGNVRQLRNAVERLVVTVHADTIHAEDLPDDLDPATPGASAADCCTLADAVETAEKATIQASLAACGYHREKSAKMLGVSVRTLHYKMNRYGLH
ncbi:Transcriptional regulatory protein ZraR [Posidoniimonas polymericola]|uniref:Transcriptional regulatory protein ZraR n=1 Tax=Posidoniimonas polymericola TaxID=2528002 RepID=A0A5C5YTA9_9BACT|nr:sigma-54 dependent transcriptional regulator [Posidoniimonas polymericola]TWT78234.1 Transcriptional regulatory protein ZraR [Posidoniimonas polymericola]